MKGKQGQKISEMVYGVSCSIEIPDKFAIFHKLNNHINSNLDFIWSKITIDLMKAFPWQKPY